MKIDCLIVDDEPVARSIIRNYCGHLPLINVVAECGNALDAKNLLSERHIDLLFLHGHTLCPYQNHGIGFLSTLKTPPQVIFTTAYQEYAVNAFDLAACKTTCLSRFRLKRFIMAVDKAKEKLEQRQTTANKYRDAPVADHFFIKSEGKIFKLAVADCLYAEAKGNYTKIVTTGDPILTKMPFSAFARTLPAEIFLQAHRSFIVNKNKIKLIEGNRIFIGPNRKIPIGESYKQALFTTLGL